MFIFSCHLIQTVTVNKHFCLIVN